MATIQTATTAAPTAAQAPEPTPITATANGSNRGTKVTLQASFQALIAGIRSAYPPEASFQLVGVTYARDEVVQALQRFIDTAEATKTSATTWRTAVQTERQVEAELRPLRSALRGIIAAKFGADSTNLLLFGFSPRKPGTKTAATKALAVAKNKATRAARGTKGKKQKRGIQGAVPAPTPAPVAPPPTPSPSPPVTPTTPTTTATGSPVPPTPSAHPSTAEQPPR